MTARSPQPTFEAARYELISRLGEGGAGVVYAALDRETGEQVALKKLSGMNPVNVLRFKREFRALANIHHRNLVQLYELEHADDGWFLTMELVDGVEFLAGLGTVKAANDNVTRDGAAAAHARVAANDEGRLATILEGFAQLAQGIHAIHQAGMLHRDLKPSNVMLSRQGRVVVLDFGLVRELAPSSAVTMEGIAAGTPAYMPPEQASGEELSAASDWYAFGVILYQAVSGGALPFEGRSPTEILQRKLGLDAPPLHRGSAPPALRDLCARLLRRNPNERPNAQEIFAQLPRAGESRMEPASLSPEPVTVQSSSELFGREAEQLQLQAAIETRIREQTTVAVHVRGPSGAGKTALVQYFLPDSTRLAVAASSELLVVRSRCYEREAMPFKAIDGAIDALANQCFKRA